MFKKFTRDDIHSRSNIKSSAQRQLKVKFVQTFPKTQEIIDIIAPKKSQISVIKCADKISLYAVENDVFVFEHHADGLIPTLRLVHKYPEYFPRVQVDRGAIKFVLSGANVMCPGLTSPGGRLDEPLEKGQVVAIFAEGKENALAIGILNMSTQEIKDKNKGIAIDLLTYLGDGLWKYTATNEL